MFRLLPEDHPLLTDAILTILRKISAGTLLEFLEAKSEDIVRHTGLPYSQITSIKETVLSKYATKPKNSSEWQKECQAKGCIIQTGIKNLDNLLSGGFKTGSMYELCGLSSSGKSQICMTAASHAIYSSTPKEAVLYIDTKRDLSVDRIQSNLAAKACENVTESLRYLHVVRPNTPYDLLSVLHDYINNPMCPRPRIVVLDSLAGIFLQLLSDQTKSLSLLSSVKSLLNYIATEMHTVVLLTNVLTWHTEETDDENLHQLQRSGLGKFWSHAPTTRITTSRLRAGQILLVVTKSSDIAVGTNSIVTITENGVI